MSHWVIPRTYDQENYGHSNFLIEIWHMLFVSKSMLVDYIIGGFVTQRLEMQY